MKLVTRMPKAAVDAVYLRYASKVKTDLLRAKLTRREVLQGLDVAEKIPLLSTRMSHGIPRLTGAGDIPFLE